MAAAVMDIMPCAGAVITQPGGFQLLNHFTVSIMAVRLIQHTAVPVQAVMVKNTQNGIRSTRDFTGRVDIINTEKPASAEVTGLKITPQCGHQRAEMKCTGR